MHVSVNAKGVVDFFSPIRTNAYVCDFHKVNYIIYRSQLAPLVLEVLAIPLIGYILCSFSGKNMETSKVLRIWKLMSKHSVLIMGTTVFFRQPYLKESLENAIKIRFSPGMMVRASDPNTLEAEQGGSQGSKPA